MKLSALALLAGAAAGLIGALFRLALEEADRARESLLAWGHGVGLAGLFVVVAICGLATAAAAWLVRRISPHASGSGIPQVEAVLARRIPEPGASLIPVKFAGGLLAIGSGLALGREGPSVQMGASVASGLGSLFRCSDDDRRALLAAGAGAGLATAFNAPIAGAVFVLEELVRRFDARITVATVAASAGAIAVARLLLRDAPDFAVAPLSLTGLAALPVCLALGLFAGALGTAYNRTLLATLARVDRLRRWPAEAFALAVGAAVGLLAWFGPELVGGGDPLTQRALVGGETLTVLSAVFLLRFALGSVSYAARTPGGLFAPILVLGAQSGLWFGTLAHRWLPDVVPNPVAMAVVGMAAFFTAVVRAPVTGIILVTEMTGSFALLLPMLAACAAAMLVRDPPIYDSLRERLLAVTTRP